MCDAPRSPEGCCRADVLVSAVQADVDELSGGEAEVLREVQ